MTEDKQVITKEQPEQPAKPPKKVKLRRRVGRWLMLTLAPPFVEHWLRWFDYTVTKDNMKGVTKYELDEVMARIANHTPSIFVLWHNRMMFGPTAYMTCKGESAMVMASRSFDGELIAATVGRFKNVEVVRGSSRSKKGRDKGGQDALAEMIEIGKQGRHDMMIIPDGPRGPVYKLKRGIIDLAAGTGLPIYPIAPACDRFLRLPGWDRTIIPLPYCNVIYRAGKGMTVPPDADEAMIEQKRLELENYMIELTNFVDHFYDQKSQTSNPKP
jgi:lysophospholipid acyltransferase (LPLAT)-like uncharacterized protein